MLRLRFPGLVLAALVACFTATVLMPPETVLAQQPTVVGPSRILFVDADTVRVLVTKQWQSAASRHQEKLLRTSLRLQYWRNRIPADMRMVFDALGYPTGRVLSQPVGHSEEWWYYGQLAPPLRFRDGALLDRARFESLAGR